MRGGTTSFQRAPGLGPGTISASAKFPVWLGRADACPSLLGEAQLLLWKHAGLTEKAQLLS